MLWRDHHIFYPKTDDQGPKCAYWVRWYLIVSNGRSATSNALVRFVHRYFVHIESGIIRLDEANNSEERLGRQASLGFIRMEPSI